MSHDPEMNESPAETASRIYKKWNTTTWFFGVGAVAAVFIGNDSEFKMVALLTVFLLLGLFFYGLMASARIKAHLSEDAFELVIRRYGWILGQTP
ncbi:hypothetical protein [Deinococcus cellulosilyticus]|uniref:Uncharacterized protein n=1 Tax=Deinococcus cellulosilyticus (strain DSM 18568 / NBRC 106333 / KACC 11606 / 5516J-15) TaxID=1223518 RepID=A0A511N9R1_DEIC1|nr:hypothetical protein [Deinococcus cellulosilyticus]GEM49569.1 hypothetical protein DC3_52040 [Deinococcus cellulosilyticus NBRC 106333 = KACC 11606]